MDYRKENNIYICNNGKSHIITYKATELVSICLKQSKLLKFYI